MPATFSRTMRSLQADSFRRTLWALLIAAAILSAWLLWLLFARVTIYEVSDIARLEADRASHPVQAQVAGQVAATHLTLDREVAAGDLLVELDAEKERLQLEEARTHLTALSRQLEALDKEIAAEERATGEDREAAQAELAEARAKFREGQASVRLADEEAARAERLHKDELISEVEFLRIKTEADKHRSAAEALRLAVSRLEQEQRMRLSDRRVRIERLQGQLTRLEGEQAMMSATIERLENEIEKHLIRAPVAGRLGEIAAALQTGTYLTEGEQVAAVVPLGELRAVAEFPPPASLGRIRPGQGARLRLEGFPWTRFGMVRATVASVGSEVRDGRVRVELTVYPDSTSRIPMQHGLPGAVEVAVEEVSPLSLLLRAAGQLLAGKQTEGESSLKPGQDNGR